MFAKVKIFSQNIEVYRTLFTSGETKRNVLKEEVTKNVEFGVEK